MPDMRVRIIGATVAVTRIHLEKVGHVSGLRDGAPGRKICDYALLAESGDGIHATLIELKSARNDEEEPREQLRRSLPVLEYLRSACDVERGTDGTRKMSVEYALVFEKEKARTLSMQRRAEGGTGNRTIPGYHGSERSSAMRSRFRHSCPPWHPPDARPRFRRSHTGPPTAPTARSAARPGGAGHPAAGRRGRCRAGCRRRSRCRNGPRAGQGRARHPVRWRRRL